ncbi:unnamed protein product [Caenorhabditis angaria]|uniref:Carbonic anhydrase n=1 Tax=Caenorhabditis angaria TaxID=860376 RepID=A0A9P1J2B0_9PELO|nr:unnamed protein product [Caenorhabditis angaria]
MLSLIYLCIFLVGVVQCGEGGGNWGYEPHNGPDHWQGDCQNHLRQSPIDIRAPDVDYALLHRLYFMNFEHAGHIEFSNNGKTLVGGGFDKWGQKQPFIQSGGLNHRYKLHSFHLHWGGHDSVGSEHAIGGLHYPAELHMVHIREGLSLGEAVTRPDGIAVVGVFLAKTNDPIANRMNIISDVFGKVKHTGNKTEISSFKTNYLLPAVTEAFYRYEGSLTTPTCSEAVIWTLLAEPIAISSHQLHLLRDIHNYANKKTEINYRPLQALNGRRIQYRPSKLDRSMICSAEKLSMVIPALVMMAKFF